MAPVPPPRVFEIEQVRKRSGQSMAGHDPAGEEVLRDPVGLVGTVEPVCPDPVGEYMDEQASVGCKPPADAIKQRPPVRHVFEHLDRDHAVERPGLECHIVHVGGDHAHVPEAPFQGLRFDVRAL